MNRKENTMSRTEYENKIGFAFEQLRDSNSITWNRLNYCSAWIAETENYIFLKSYRTIVAVYNKHTQTLYDILRVEYGYTSTSSQHISKFRHMLDIKKTVRIDYIDYDN